MKSIVGLVLALFGIIIFEIGLSEENWVIYAIGVVSLVVGVGIVVIDAVSRKWQ